MVSPASTAGPLSKAVVQQAGAFYLRRGNGELYIASRSFLWQLVWFALGKGRVVSLAFLACRAWVGVAGEG